MFFTPEMIRLLSDSSASLSKYNGIITNPSLDPSIFLSPLEIKEAVLSSKIEGTRTTLDDALRFDADFFSSTVSQGGKYAAGYGSPSSHNV